MKEPSPHSSRIALAGGLAAILLVGGGGFYLGRVTNERPPEIVTLSPPPTSPDEPEEPARGLLERVDLIALATAQADATARGLRSDEAGDADGRRFELRLPFGCEGPAVEGSTAAMRWRFDEDDSALRVHVATVVWSTEDWWSANAPAEVEAIEGFWIMRPWSLEENCPRSDGRPAAIGAEPVTLPGQTLAIGQIFSTDGARSARRDGEAYEAVIRVPEDELDFSRGLRLRVTGRLARVGEDGPVRCQQPAGAEQRPICLVGVLFDEIAIENPANGETLASWSVGQRPSPTG